MGLVLYSHQLHFFLSLSSSPPFASEANPLQPVLPPSDALEILTADDSSDNEEELLSNLAFEQLSPLPPLPQSSTLQSPSQSALQNLSPSISLPSSSSSVVGPVEPSLVPYQDSSSKYSTSDKLIIYLLYVWLFLPILLSPSFSLLSLLALSASPSLFHFLFSPLPLLFHLSVDHVSTRLDQHQQVLDSLPNLLSGQLSLDPLLLSSVSLPSSWILLAHTSSTFALIFACTVSLQW